MNVENNIEPIRTFAAHYYTDAAIFARELNGLLSRTWQFAGHLSQVSNNGNYFCFEIAAADDFTMPFQKAMTAWCWGFGWGDEAIDAKTRSMINLAMIGALGKMKEWEIHCRGALNNGVSKEEIRAIIHIVGIYCGVPQALECFRSAKKVLEEQEA